MPPSSDGATSREGRLGILRSTAGLSAITMGSRVLGLVREQVRAHFLGTSLASDAFGASWRDGDLPSRVR